MNRNSDAHAEGQEVLRAPRIQREALPPAAHLLSLVVALLTFVGAAIGGSLVLDYGFNAKTAGDSPAWHESEVDLMPGQKPPAS